jgi:glucose-6-phosphate 1-dehydrogenase
MAASAFYSVGDFGDHDSYVRLRQFLDQLDREHGTQGNRLYYLAAPPRFFGDIVHNLGAAGLVYTGNQGAQLLGPGQRLPSLPTPGAPEAWSRVVVEKPFGRDLASAQELNRVVGQSFSEDQIHRIDHYLGKETVQNILVLRFANGIFEPLWNQNYVDHVQITVAEDIGVGTRGDYFDAAGILRDMVENHMLQLLCLTAMEPPVAFDADAVRGEKVKVLRALRPLVGEAVATHTARGQYGPGWAQGEHVAGYREAPDVAPDSQTETYVALKVFVDNWRWAGVPFYLRAGKRLPKRVTEIAIQFKAIPYSLLTGSPESDVAPNVLVLRLQPDEGISLRIGCKAPGPAVAVQPVKMEFLYGTAFGFEPPEAYERLLFDVLTGDSTLFTRRDEVEAAWRWITPVLDYWHRAPAPEFPNYAAGTWGPPEAQELIEADGRAWRRS